MTRAMAEKTRATNRCDWSNVCAADVVVHTCAVRDKKKGVEAGGLCSFEVLSSLRTNVVARVSLLGNEFVSYFLRKREGI